MFTLSAAPVTFYGLLILFGFTTVWELVRLLRRSPAPNPSPYSGTGANHGAHAAPVTASNRISGAMHLLMSLLMLAMVPTSVYGPVSRVLPLGAQIVLMSLGLLWFVVLATRTRPGHRAHAIGCAVMFAAMVWHLAAMREHMHHMEAMTMTHSMGGMEHMAPMGPSWMETASRPGGELWWFAVVGVVLMAALLWLALVDLLAAVRRPGHRLDHLAGFAMNFGMFWMSTGLLAPLMPWITVLRF